MINLKHKWYEKPNLTSHEKFCAVSVANLSILLFYVLTIIYSYFVYQHISFTKIAYASSLYLVFLVTVAHLFKFELFKISINWLNLFLSLILTIFLFMLMTIPLEIYFKDYFRTFPLMEADEGVGTGMRGWYDDTVFHVSIIQSILNFGYPSIGQHSSPLMIYHVATHYFDALISLLTGLDPFDSYTLNSTFKRFVYLSALLLLAARMASIAKMCILLFLLSSFVFITASVDTWHTVISHGLWLPSVILILTAPLVFNLIVSNRDLALSSLIFLFLLVIFISLGKVSHGFMLGAFIGFALLIKQPNNFKIYLLGIFWLFFFYYYSQQMPVDVSKNKGLNFNNLSLITFYEFLTSSYFIRNGIVSIFILAFCGNFYKSKTSYILFAASSVLIISAYVICLTSKVLGPADKVYFQMGTSSIILTFAFINFAYHASLFHQKSGMASNHQPKDKKLILIFGLLASVLLLKGAIFNAKTPNILEMIKKRNTEPFLVMNNSLLQTNLSLSQAMLNPSMRSTWYLKEGRPIFKFRASLHELLEKNNINKRDAIMFIPSGIYPQLPHDYGDKWAAGMFVYSITGVPLLNALIDENIRGYGIFLYGDEAYRIKRNDFNFKSKCIEYKMHNIIIVDSITPPRMTLKRCDS